MDRTRLATQIRQEHTGRIKDNGGKDQLTYSTGNGCVTQVGDEVVRCATQVGDEIVRCVTQVMR